MKNRVIWVIVSVGVLLLNACSNDHPTKRSSQHPRIYGSNDSKAALIESVANVQWKKELIAKKKENLEKYILLCEEDSCWLLSRLQMNWNTRHSEVYFIFGWRSAGSHSAFFRNQGLGN